MSTRHLAHMFIFALACASNIAESAPSAPGPGQDISAGCKEVDISRSWKDQPYNADLEDTDEQYYSFTLLKCEGSQNFPKGFLLRVDSVDIDSGEKKKLDVLSLPFVSPDQAQYMDPTCNMPMGQEVDAKGPPVTGAIGQLVKVDDDDYEVKKIIWAWSFNPKTRQLRLLHPDKKFYCTTDGAYAP